MNMTYRNVAMHVLTLMTLTLLPFRGLALEDSRCSVEYTPTLPGYDFTAGIDRWGQKTIEHGLPTPIRVNQIHVNTQPIFNVLDEREDKWLYRLANRLHVDTRPDVLRKFVLFEPGSLVDDQVLSESERLLRDQRFVSDAAIDVVRHCEDFVDLEIITREVWTMVPDIRFKTGGGNATFGLGFKDTNFLGSGNRVGATFVSEPERDRSKLHYVRQNLFDSRTKLDLTIEQNTDGHVRLVGLSDDFYSLATPHAWGVGVADTRREVSTYQLGNVIDKFELQHRWADLWFGTARTSGKMVQRKRYGLRFEDVRYDASNSNPGSGTTEDRSWLYPFVEWQWIEDDFGVAYNINQIHQAEDIHLGMDLRTRFGVTLSGANRFIFEGDYIDTWTSRNKQLLQTAFNWHGRWNFETSQAEDVLAALSITYHRGQTRNRNLYLNLKLTNTWHHDPESSLTIGGTTGLRGYPADFLSGKRSYLFTAEQRLFTDWHPLNLFRVGFAAFFDAGKVIQGASSSTISVNGEGQRWLYDVGLGLRLIPDKTSRHEVIHIDVGYPLKKVPGASGPQFLIELRKTL